MGAMMTAVVCQPLTTWPPTLARKRPEPAAYTSEMMLQLLCYVHTVRIDRWHTTQLQQLQLHPQQQTKLSALGATPIAMSMVRTLPHPVGRGICIG